MTFLATINSIAKDSAFFDHVVFSTNGAWAEMFFFALILSFIHSIFLDLTTEDVLSTELGTQQAFSAAWSSLVPDFDPSHIHVLPSIEHAIREVETISTVSSKPVQVLVTGSLHLVGGVIEVAGLSELAL